MVIYYKTSNTFWNVTTKLVHRSIYLKYPMKLGKIFEDNEVACKWLYEAIRVTEIDLELYFYRQRENSIMSQKVTINRLDAIEALYSRYLYIINL